MNLRKEEEGVEATLDASQISIKEGYDRGLY